MSKKDDVVVKNSPIDRRGVFAEKKFKKGETVLTWDVSETISREEFESLSEDQKDYIAFCDGTYVVMHPPEKYINHSCNPNTKSVNFIDIAIRNVEKGEEITADYSRDLAPGERMRCTCGSLNCSGEIVAFG